MSPPRQVVNIGVTGHRMIGFSEALESGVKLAFRFIQVDYPDAEYNVLTALAQGSDRLVTTISREISQVKLVVVQPVCAGEVLEAPVNGEDAAVVDGFLQSAVKIIRLPDAATHAAAYRSLGMYLAQECDVLLAVWNGVYNHKQGGTSDVVRSTRSLGKPVYWVYCDNEAVGTSNPLSGRKSAGELELIRADEEPI
ncbi:MAG TPA: hypothetical protein PK040_07350 [Anaerolineaceae bacterium]|nr:hypothetical protein [Anaerolineaceae bacterium]